MPTGIAPRWARNNRKDYYSMKNLHHLRREPQEPACQLGASGIVITDGDSDDPCELLVQLNLAYWIEDVNSYMRTCPTAPSSPSEKTTLTVALALRGAGVSGATAESMVLRMRQEASEPVLSVTKIGELVARAYAPDSTEWRGLVAGLGRGATE